MGRSFQLASSLSCCPSLPGKRTLIHSSNCTNQLPIERDLFVSLHHVLSMSSLQQKVWNSERINCSFQQDCSSHPRRWCHSFHVCHLFHPSSNYVTEEESQQEECKKKYQVVTCQCLHCPWIGGISPDDHSPEEGGSLPIPDFTNNIGVVSPSQ